MNKIGYIAGYFLANLLLAFVYINQPALIYGCTFVCILSLVTSSLNKEINDYWNGKSVNTLVFNLINLKFDHLKFKLKDPRIYHN